MKFLLDFFPILLFFVAYKSFGFFTATAVIIGATVLQVGYFWIRHRRVEKMHLITLALVTVLGGITLILQDEMFLKWKPTLVNWLFAVAFLGSHFIGQRTMVERMLNTAVTLPPFIWRRLNLGWTGFFVAMGAVNLYVAYHYDTETWVDFKVFGLLGLTLLFVVVQAFYLARHMAPDEAVVEGPEKGGS